LGGAITANAAVPKSDFLVIHRLSLTINNEERLSKTSTPAPGVTKQPGANRQGVRHSGV
jgi:hypothetical protein